MIAICFFSVLAILLSAWISRTTPHRAFLLGTLAIAIRITGIIVIPEIYLFDDELGYAAMGRAIASALEHNRAIIWEDNMWANLTGALYYLLGESEYTVRAFNAGVGVILAFLLEQIALALYKDRLIANRALKFALFGPPLIFISCLALKELWIGFLLVLIVYGSVVPGRAKKILIPIALIGVRYFRADLLVQLLPLLGVHAWWYMTRPQRKYSYRHFRRVLNIFAIVVAGLTAYYLGFHSDYFAESKLALIVRGENEAGVRALGESSANYASFIDSENIFSLRTFLFIPINFLYSPNPLRMLFAPTEENILSSLLIVVFVYLATPYFFIGVIESIRRRNSLLPSTIYGMVFLMASFSVLTSAPEPFRYRLPGLPLFFLEAAHGKHLRGHQTRWRRLIMAGWWSSALLVAIVYAHLNYNG